MKKDLTTGTPWKIVLLFALPIMAGNLLQQLYNTADTIIVGNFQGETALSAVGTCASLTMLFTALAIGFSAGAGVYLAQRYGAKKIDQLRKGVCTSIVVMLVMGLLAAIVGVATSGVILKYAMNVPQSLLEMATAYFTVYSIGLFFQFGYNIIAAILRSIGDSRATLYFLLISSVINIILDLVFVGVFHWGVVGAAVATDISQLCSFLFGLVYMSRKYEILRFKKEEFTYDKDVAKTVLKVGLPMAIQQVVVSCGFVFIQRLVNSYGEAMTASFTVASRLENYCMIPITAFQNTMATYCGQNKGAGKNDRISSGILQTVIMSAVITAVISAAVFALRQPIIQLFGITGQSAEYCMEHMSFMCMVFVIFAVYFPANGLLQGVGEGFYATLCALIALGGRVLFSYTLSGVNAIGYRAIWYSMPIAWTITLLVCYIHFFRGKWKTVAMR